jgi:hypothetical protein
MNRGLIRLLIVAGFAVAVLGAPAARGDDGEQNPPAPPPLQAFDPSAAIAALAGAASDQSAPAGPSMGLATPITVDPLLGSATASIPIDVPPGRKLTPDLTIRYSSNAGNGMFGVGWDLPLGSIQRNTAHGVPARDDSGNYLWKDFVLVLRGQTIMLDAAVAPAAGCDKAMAARSEEVWLSPCYHASANQWVITTKDGTVYTYGGQEQARTGANVSREGGTFGWYLTGVESPEGNTIQIAYRWFSMIPWWGYDGMAYPDHIDYGAHANAPALAAHKFHVAFEYNDPARDPRPDVITSYRAGFAQSVSRRVTAIDVWVDGISTPGTPTRRYSFSYT